MRIDPFAPQLLVDYDYFCRRHGHLDFGDFIPLWHAAGALIEDGLAHGYSFEELLPLAIDGLQLDAGLIRSAAENEPADSENSLSEAGNTISMAVRIRARYGNN